MIGGPLRQVVDDMAETGLCLQKGRVIAAGAGEVRISLGQERYAARRAMSCLVDPRPGDLVLAVVENPELAYILAVLERPETAGQPTDLVVDGPARLRVDNGSLTIQAESDLNLAAGRELAAVSDRVSIRAQRARARITNCSFVGRFFRSQLGRVQAVALEVDQVCRRLTQRLEESYRYVREHDEVQAGSSRLLVEDLYTVHSKNTLVMAEEHVTINGQQINLG